jgi:hypothetical protein
MITAKKFPSLFTHFIEGMEDDFFVKSYRASVHSLYKESNIATEMERSTKQPEKRFLENLKNNQLWTYRYSLRAEIVVKANLVKKFEKISNNRKIVLKIVFFFQF